KPRLAPRDGLAKGNSWGCAGRWTGRVPCSARVRRTPWSGPARRALDGVVARGAAVRGLRLGLADLLGLRRLRGLRGGLGLFLVDVADDGGALPAGDDALGDLQVDGLLVHGDDDAVLAGAGEHLRARSEAGLHFADLAELLVLAEGRPDRQSQQNDHEDQEKNRVHERRV